MDDKKPRSKRGRKPHSPPLKAHCVNITIEQARLLRTWGKGDLSAGLRWLIDTGSILIRKANKE